MTRWVEHKACIGYTRKVYESYVGNTERKRLLGKHMHRWACNIEIVPRELLCEDVNWIDLTENLVHWVGCCYHGNEILGFIKSGEFL